MALTLIGKKIGMTQVYQGDGTLTTVTVIQAGPCMVLQKKTKETDGYEAIQLGFAEKKAARSNKAMLGHCKKAGDKAFYVVRETPDDGKHGELKVGDAVTVKEYVARNYVDVIGITKGKGFQGVVRRHGFRGGDMTHGAKGWHRRAGAIGQRSFPGTVRRGLRMPGHMGSVQRTVQNLEVIQVREDDNLLLIKGSVSGPNGGYVMVRPSKKKAGKQAPAREAQKPAPAKGAKK